MDTWRLDMLPDDVLLLIFDYCDLCDFTHLDKVCKRFHYIIHSNMFWNCHYRKLLVTNQVSEQFRKRCNLLLPSYSKYFISQNWIQGRYQERILQDREFLYSKLQLTSDKLWWSNRNMLFGFDRQEKTLQKTNTVSCDNICPKIKKDIRSVILWRDYIVTGHENGSIMWQAESPEKNEYNGCYECIVKKQMSIHNTYTSSIVALDATSNVIFSASPCEYAIIRLENSVDIDSINNDSIVRDSLSDSEIISLAINPLGTIASVTVEVGTAEIESILNIDLEHLRSFSEYQITNAAPLFIMKDRPMLWEDPNTLLTCFYSTINKWDLRVNHCVTRWNYLESQDTESPLKENASASAFSRHKYRILCISSDYHNTMITGTCHSQAILWDQRMRNFVQIYSMPVFDDKYCDSTNPICSLQFDSTSLYCATNHFLYEFDFYKRGCPVRDDYKSSIGSDQYSISPNQFQENEYNVVICDV